MRSLSPFLIFILCSTLHACVTPPRIENAQVVPEQELEVVSYINKGKRYAGSGRLDLAEVEFRNALRLRPNLSSLHNDLGFTLQAQDRPEEAAEMFRRAVQLEPRNLNARENLARILYAQGDTENSIKEFETLLSIYYGLQPREIKAVLGHEYTPSEIALIHRSLALAYYRFGAFDESICQSTEAVKGPVGDFSQVGQHARLLLSLGRSQATANYLHDVIEVWQDQTPGRLFVDYALALMDINQKDLGRDALERSLKQKDLDEGDRRYVQLLIGINPPSGSRPSEVLPESIAENDEDGQFCKQVAVDPYGYWPVGVVTQAKSLLSRWCHDEKQSVVSG